VTDEFGCLYEAEYEYLKIPVQDAPSDAEALASQLETTSEFIGKFRVIRVSTSFWKTNQSTLFHSPKEEPE
jgi:hypothetical protein